MGICLNSAGGPGPYHRSGTSLGGWEHNNNDINKALQAIQSPRTVPFFLVVSLLDGYSFPNVLVKGIVEFKH